MSEASDKADKGEVEAPAAEAKPRRKRSFSGSDEGRRTVVVAVDASEDSSFAFEWFLEHIHQKEDMVILVHCPEIPKLPSLSFKSPIAPPVSEWKNIMEETNARTRKLEENYESTCVERKIKYKVRGDSVKNPGEGIVNIAEEEKAEMIIMGTRGLGKIKRALLGSVSDYVVRNSMLPVVIVPSATKAAARKISQSSK